MGEVPRDSDGERCRRPGGGVLLRPEKLAGAETAADDIAAANVSDAASTQPGTYPQGCVVEGGQVTVYSAGSRH